VAASVNRQHPLFSPIGCLTALLLVAGLVIAVLLSGGAVFSPGRLTALAASGAPLDGFASHAEFEIDCSQCHAPFRGVEAARCENCHAGVAAERMSGNGLHAGILAKEVARCGSCHSDHKGRNFDPANVSLANFDHSATSFVLTTHQKLYDGSPFTCKSCHAGGKFAFDEQACIDCHNQADAGFIAEHVQSFGSDCLGCHDGTGNLTNFDHGTVFPLEGAHATVECAACHVNKVFKGMPTACAACHAEPDMHTGLFSMNCAECHTTAAWSPAQFNMPHTFPLDHGEEGLLACSTCHETIFREFICYRCHEQAEMIGKHGEEGIGGPRLENCVECHATGRKTEEEQGEGGGD
jgi:hypothetical protein